MNSRIRDYWGSNCQKGLVKLRIMSGGFEGVLQSKVCLSCGSTIFPSHGGDRSIYSEKCGQYLMRS